MKISGRREFFSKLALFGGFAALAAQAIQHDADLLLRRILLPGRPADVLHDPLRWRFSAYGFVSHLHSLVVTMSQKSSVPQVAKSVSQALIPDMREVPRWLAAKGARPIAFATAREQLLRQGSGYDTPERFHWRLPRLLPSRHDVTR